MRRAPMLPLALLVTGLIAVQGPASGAAASHPAPAAGSPAAAPDGTHVQVRDQYFTPTTVPIARGGTVVFDFVGQGHHTATDDSGLNLYDSGTVDGGGPSTSYTFAAAGVYRFTCTPHPFMGGRVEVPVRAAPASGSAGDGFTVTWATAPPEEGYVQDLQIQRPGEVWTPWRHGALRVSKVFRPDAGTGVYRFRARLRISAGDASSLWSLPDEIRVTR